MKQKPIIILTILIIGWLVIRRHIITKDAHLPSRPSIHSLDRFLDDTKSGKMAVTDKSVLPLPTPLFTKNAVKVTEEKYSNLSLEPRSFSPDELMNLSTNKRIKIKSAVLPKRELQKTKRFGELVKITYQNGAVLYEPNDQVYIPRKIN